MLSEERLAEEKAWFNDPLRKTLINESVLRHANALLADATEARTLLKEALSVIRDWSWDEIAMDDTDDETRSLCGECANMKFQGHEDWCNKGKFIAKLEAALQVAPWRAAPAPRR